MLSIIGSCVLAVPAIAQRVDTIRFHSDAFDAERIVRVHLPEFHRYASDAVRFPVIIVLDGQHDWFINPVLNDITYLQNTHQVPQAIVVTVPHEDRVAECATDSITQAGMPLLTLLTRELPPLLAPYTPSDISVLVGHSFTASFALHAYLNAPGAFDAVIALSPLHQVSQSLPLAATRLVSAENERVLLAVGGADACKDGGHHDPLVAAWKAAAPERAHGRLTMTEHPSASHTLLPIVAFPELVSRLFTPYAMRDSLAAVGPDYTLRAPPPSPQELLQQLQVSWGFLGSALPWDLAEANGMLSRLDASGYGEHVRLLLRKAIEMYPRYYGFHAWLGESLLEVDEASAKASLRSALELLDQMERDSPDYATERAAILELLGG